MNCALIVAAGFGTRMGIEGGKQFLNLMGKPVLAHTLVAFQNTDAIDAIVVVTIKENFEQFKDIVEEFGIKKLAAVIEGGKERADSVYNGLMAIKSLGNIDNVVIHDGARPLIEPDVIQRVVNSLDGFDGVVAGVPAVDTIKLVEDDIIIETLDRSRTWQAQTPQVFHIDTLIQAHEVARAVGYIGTDDSVLVERAGGKVKMVPGSRENMKMTNREDLIIAETILKSRASLQ
ncbi:MAG: 2-C-methyl-D-erythritol 4-phosphate cytidylyltransferase [Rubrobacteridae bacterium]|nr:2-C-methyl-D-erythritol 4-phosphate cytidylyltransferase [Rubrobacteridae bacterium]